MDEVVIILARGIGTGAVFALVAMSFNVIYNASGILNFAQGHMLILGGIVGFLFFAPDDGVLLWIVLIPVAAGLLAALMAVQGYVTLLPLRSSVEQHSWLITTLAVSVIISAIILLVKGPFAITVRSPFPNFPLLGTRTPSAYALAPVLAGACYFGLRWFHSRTLTGLAMSALAQDIDAARAGGIRVRRLQVLSFAISGAILGAAGFVTASVLAISPSTPINYVLNGFIAGVVGGLGNNAGALIGGPLLGAAAMLAAYEFGGEFQNLVSLAILVAVLMVRPQGLFGRAAARRV